MVFGIVTIYSWRPHVEHAYLLGKLLEKLGHKVYYMSCGGVDHCYNHLLKDKYKFECLKCGVGNIDTYTMQTSFKVQNTLHNEVDELDNVHDWLMSSVSTLARNEGNELTEQELKYIDLLAPSARNAYNSAKLWFEKNKIQHVMLFNGRIDMLRAVREAATSANLPYTCFERSWFGRGICLYKEEDCLGLKNINRIVNRWIDVPLVESQVRYSLNVIKSRFSGTQIGEWRNFKRDGLFDWANCGKKKILILPSSISEIKYNNDWWMDWSSPIEAFTTALQQLNLLDECIIVRGHPIWAENIGNKMANEVDTLYNNFSTSIGAKYLCGDSNVDTHNLIAQADLVILTSSSAALEAVSVGVPVLSMQNNPYSNGKFVFNARSMDELKQLHIGEVLNVASRATRLIYLLRFIYIISIRFSFLSKHAKAKNSSEYHYSHDMQAMAYELAAFLVNDDYSSDYDCALDSAHELKAANQLEKEEYKYVNIKTSEDLSSKHFKPLKASKLSNCINLIRKKFPAGDR